MLGCIVADIYMQTIISRFRSLEFTNHAGVVHLLPRLGDGALSPDSKKFADALGFDKNGGIFCYLHRQGFPKKGENIVFRFG